MFAGEQSISRGFGPKLIPCSLTFPMAMTSGVVLEAGLGKRRRCLSDAQKDNRYNPGQPREFLEVALREEDDLLTTLGPQSTSC